VNKCAFAKINNYFQNGVLPKNGSDSFCEIEVGPWNVTIKEGLRVRDTTELLKREIAAL
jgi:hypothetical protein